MSEQLWWYATRAAGLMTWTTATASVVIGLLLSTRALRNRTGPWLVDLHRFLGGISVVFLLAHIGTLWADSYMGLGPRELLVPGASEWRTEALAWGIVATYLMIAVEITSILRSHIGKYVWGLVHFLSFGAMAGGSYHAFLAGSDVENPITWAIAGIGSLLVIGLITMRLQRLEDPDEAGPTRKNDQRALLEEMRQRLEDLPIPESTPRPQISVEPNAVLPRRSPVSDSLPGIHESTATPTSIPTATPIPTSAPMPTPTAPPTDPVGFSDDPFAAVPLPSREPALGDWAAPSPADPFNVREPAAPSAPTPVPPAEPAPEPLTQPGPWDATGADLFEGLSDDPFDAMGIAPAPEPEHFPEPPPAEEKPDLFATPAGSELSADFLQTKFVSPVAGEPVIREPEPAAPAAEGPPPLPDAIDPLTGEPDEAAYTEWLKDWLSFAERYGDEAPDDPTRL